MTDRNDEIRQANRKALPRFLLTMFCAALVGGTFGYCAAAFGLDGMAGGLKQAGEFFSLYIAPWLLLCCAAAQPLVSIPIYLRAKGRLAGWDGEDETVSEQVERTLSILLVVTAMFCLTAMFLLGASYAAPILTGEDPHLMSLVGVPIFFIASMVEALLIQQRIVDLSKRLAPEKKASIYDMHFQKKWFDSCDEAEKLIIGQCAYKAYSASSKVCVGLWLVFTLSALFLETGLLPILAVCLIWAVSQCVYSYWSIKLSSPGANIL